MRVATWNINGSRARLPVLLDWLRAAEPDVACLQEIKSLDEAFPRAEVEELGYHVETHGQKGFNGVAIVSKAAPEEVVRGLPGDDGDEQARFIEAVFASPPGSCRGPLRVVSLYLPNGNPTGTDKYDYKLAWMERLIAWTRAALEREEAFALMGDYNVVPTAADRFDSPGWAEDALWLLPSREHHRRLRALGLYEAMECVGDEPGRYTFWDYKAGAWAKDRGMRIDHALLSPEATDRLRRAWIDRHVRGWEKTSDHVPVVVELG